MQLGTRWTAGAKAPATLPAAMTDAIERVESGLTGATARDWRWTLTWLEGRPIVESDSGVRLRFEPGTEDVVIEQLD